MLVKSEIMCIRCKFLFDIEQLIAIRGARSSVFVYNIVFIVTKNSFYYDMKEKHDLDFIVELSSFAMEILVDTPLVGPVLEQGQGITIKTICRQWFWSYEYSDFKQIEFDSFIICKSTTNQIFSLLDVDSLTINANIRILTSASDVLRSWKLPRLGAEVDATPGRLNKRTFFY